MYLLITTYSGTQIYLLITTYSGTQITWQYHDYSSKTRSVLFNNSEIPYTVRIILIAYYYLFRNSNLLAYYFITSYSGTQSTCQYHESSRKTRYVLFNNSKIPYTVTIILAYYYLFRNSNHMSIFMILAVKPATRSVWFKSSEIPYTVRIVSQDSQLENCFTSLLLLADPP